MNKQARERLILARTDLVIDAPFFGALALRLNLVEDPSCKTAYTNGNVLGYNPDYINSLDPYELRYLIAHEGPGHCGLGHIWRRGHRRDDKWNVACDHAVNLMLNEAIKENTLNARMPKGGIADAQFAGMSAEAIYAKLPDQPSGKNGKGGYDKGFGEVRDNAQPEEAETEWKQAVHQAAMAAHAVGKLPGSIAKLVDLLTKPAIDWRSLLRRFVQENAKNDYSWRRPNKRFVASGLYLPEMKSEQMPPLAVFIDISGSTSAHQEQFGAEMASIVEDVLPERTVVVYCCSRVQKVVEYERGEFVTEHVQGNGGTDFRPPFDYLAEHEIEPACAVYLTDLEGPFPEAPEYPVLWASVTEGAQAPFGETVYIGEA